MKFHTNPSRWSRVIPCRQTDGRTDLMKLTVAFCNFVNRLKNIFQYNNLISISSPPHTYRVFQDFPILEINSYGSYIVLNLLEKVQLKTRKSMVSSENKQQFKTQIKLIFGDILTCEFTVVCQLQRHKVNICNNKRKSTRVSMDK